ncbi:MAG: hypothetical protein JW928_08025 [Candidatus Aureabacteria bacterium]|nr:hypothetical protein [Candidatus Auribacterota bacterium]
MRLKHSICILFFSFLIALLASRSAFAADESDYISFTFDMETVFEFSAEIYVDPDYVPPNPSALAFPSQNNVTAGQNLNDCFDLGYLIGYKTSGEVNLVSEYKVLVKFQCLTNRGRKYTVSQYLTSAIVDTGSSLTLPEDIFVCKGHILDGEGDPSKGMVKVTQVVPVSILTDQVLYESNDLIDVDLSNTFRVFYWITDNSSSPLTMDQKAGTYKTTIVFTLQEEL